MQLGHLGFEAKKFKTAREAWLECIELEGDDPITTARESLMRMYLDLKRYDGAFRLGERLTDDWSVCIRFSVAVVAAKENKPEAEKYIVRAIQANPFCAYYLAFYDTFNGVMEYTEELEEAEDEPQSSLEEAIEYCCSNHAAMWLDSKANVTLRNILVRAAQGNHSELSPSDLEWNQRLTKIEVESERLAQVAALKAEEDESSNDEQEKDDDSQEDGHSQGDRERREEDSEDGSRDDSQQEDESEDGSEEKEKIDVRMYAGMFRTAMEMLQESGQLGLPLASIKE